MSPETRFLQRSQQQWRSLDASRTPPQPRSPYESPEFLAQVRSRLGVLALVLAGMTVASGGAAFVMYELLEWAPPPVWRALRVMYGLMLAMSLGVFGLTRWSKLPDYAMPMLGVVFEVVGAFVICFPGFSSDLLLQENMGRLPWVALWVAMFPLVVPFAPLKAALVSFGSASMCPLVFFGVAGLSGRALPETSVLVNTFLPVYIAAGFSLVPAILMYRMGSSVTAAEDRVQQLGSYKLVEKLGQGGMGEVWRAEHSLLTRPAAVKLISTEFLDQAEPSEKATTLARFEREARTTSSLRSPHTIALYDFGLTPEGSLFYVMELLEGTDLESLVFRFGPVSARRVVHILEQACCSLAEAHEAGMVHRDIKPANVYLCTLGVTHDFVKVLDFGLVGVTTDMRRTNEVRLTEEGFIVGTPAFMPPEMAEGKPLDGRADIYSLGCVAYWLLTGEFVFEEESAIKMIISHVKHDPERPSKRLRKPIPADLEELILTCLAKDPADRPQTACELAERLQACDVPPWTQQDARAWWTKHGPLLAEELTEEVASVPTRSWAPKPPPSE